MDLGRAISFCRMVQSSFLSFVGRSLFVAIFVGSTYEKVAHFDKETGGPMTTYMAPKLDNFLAKVQKLTGFEVTSIITRADYPRILMTAAVCEGLGAMLFVMDISFGAIVLLIFIIPTSVIMHNFWDAPDLKVYNVEMIQFLKNVSMVGALLIYLGSGSGTTVEERRREEYGKYDKP